MARKNAKELEEIKEENAQESSKAPEEVAKQGNVLKSEKEVLLDLYKTLKDLGINSIGDLEVKISRL